MNRGTGLASINRYFAWGSELRPWPGELEYLSGVTLRMCARDQCWFPGRNVTDNTQSYVRTRQNTTHERSV